MLTPSYVANKLHRTVVFDACLRLKWAIPPSHRTRLSTIGDQTFPAAAACVWNNLPQYSYIVSLPSLSNFSIHLKADFSSHITRCFWTGKPWTSKTSAGSYMYLFYKSTVEREQYVYYQNANILTIELLYAAVNTTYHWIFISMKVWRRRNLIVSALTKHRALTICHQGLL